MEFSKERRSLVQFNVVVKILMKSKATTKEILFSSRYKRDKHNSKHKRSFVKILAPGNTDKGCRMCWVERSGGNKGGSWGSGPVEFEDEGEVIGGSFAAAIKLLPAVWLRRASDNIDKVDNEVLKTCWQWQASFVILPQVSLQPCRWELHKND